MGSQEKDISKKKNTYGLVLSVGSELINQPQYSKFCLKVYNI